MEIAHNQSLFRKNESEDIKKGYLTLDLSDHLTIRLYINDIKLLMRNDHDIDINFNQWQILSLMYQQYVLMRHSRKDIMNALVLEPFMTYYDGIELELLGFDSLKQSDVDVLHQHVKTRFYPVFNDYALTSKQKSYQYINLKNLPENQDNIIYEYNTSCCQAHVKLLKRDIVKIIKPYLQMYYDNSIKSLIEFIDSEYFIEIDDVDFLMNQFLMHNTLNDLCVFVNGLCRFLNIEIIDR